MPQLQPRVREYLLKLSAHSSVGGLVCSAVSRDNISGPWDVRRICSTAGIALSRSAEVVAFLEAASRLGLFQKTSELNWRVLDLASVEELVPMLQAIAFYRADVHLDADSVDVVITKPPSPSRLTQSLEKTLLGTWGLLDTREVLPLIAEQATQRFAVVTPFLDETGAQILLGLFANTQSSARKQLVLRTTPAGEFPSGYLSAATEFRKLGVKTYNFRLEKLESLSTETFHAKIVLADSRKAYVGSSNMNRWSFQYSLEVGLLVSGRSAERIGQIVDALLEVSEPVL